jgi:hypothetical protein
VRTVLEADGVLDQIGRDHIHGNVQRAVRTQLEAPSTGRRRPTP